MSEQWHEYSARIKLPYECFDPLFALGSLMQTLPELGSVQGRILGLKRQEGPQGGWLYLLHSAETEQWVKEADLLPVDKQWGGICYRDRWHITGEEWKGGYIYVIYDSEMELESTGLSSHSSYPEALVAGCRFIDREFAEAVALPRVA